MLEGYFFRSTLFEAEPGEDEQTNPRIYGRQLARWLKTRMVQCGYEVEEIIAEDWGWCVMCQRTPYSLWIGCANVGDYDTEKPDDPPPGADEIVWHAFPVAEVPFFKRLFGRVDTKQGLDALDGALKSALLEELEVELIDAP